MGAPAEVYERPSSAFVAGFVGTSNVFDGELANRLRGSAQAFTVRPEKVHLIAADREAGPGDGEVRVTGQVRTAVYLGDRTRYTVDLHGGGVVVAVEQNGGVTRAGAAEAGATVRVAWDRRFDQVLPHPPDAPTTTAAGDVADAADSAPRPADHPTQPLEPSPPGPIHDEGNP